MAETGRHSESGRHHKAIKANTAQVCRGTQVILIREWQIITVEGSKARLDTWRVTFKIKQETDLHMTGIQELRKIKVRGRGRSLQKVTFV